MFQKSPRVRAPSSKTSNLSRAWERLRGTRKLAFMQAGLAIVEGLTEAAILTLFARLALEAVDDSGGAVYVPGLGDASTGFAIKILVTLVVSRLITGLLSSWLATRLQFKLVRQIRRDAIKAYSLASWRSQDRLDDGALQQFFVTLPNGISNHLAGLILQFSHFAIMLAMLGYAMLTDAILTMVLIAIVFAATYAFSPLRRWIKQRASRALREQESLSSSTAEVGSLRLEAHAFGVSAKLMQPLLSVVESEAKEQEQVGFIRGTVVPLYTTITYLAVTFGILFLSSTSSNNFDKTGPILLVVLRSLSYGTALQQAATGLATLTPSLDFLERRASELSSHSLLWGSSSLKELKSLEFERVSFAYDSHDAPALHAATVRIEVGSKVGVVGPSGSGKTTFTRLLLGLLEPDSGAILINGRPLRHYSQSSWQHLLGVVPQTTTLIHGTIRENVRFFRSEINETDIWYGLELADLSSEIASMPDGLDTVIGGGSRDLSGGQRQRLAIARAFAGRPRLVVMDEPTASIDSLSEEAVSDAMSRLDSKVTLVIVSHRPRILKDCSQILVIERSEITAAGTPEEVLQDSEYLVRVTEHPGLH